MPHLFWCIYAYYVYILKEKKKEFHLSFPDTLISDSH